MFPADLDTRVESITKVIEGKTKFTVLTFGSKNDRKRVLRSISSQNKWHSEYDRASDGAIQIVMKSEDYNKLILGRKQMQRIKSIHEDYYDGTDKKS